VIDILDILSVWPPFSEDDEPLEPGDLDPDIPSVFLLIFEDE